MAHGYKPSAPFNVAMKLLIPTTKNVTGTTKKTYPFPDDAPLIFGSFRTFTGTETTVNDLYTVVATGYIDTWYRPDIKANCRIYLCETEETYEVLGEPENISMRNQYIKMRVRKVGGGA